MPDSDETVQSVSRRKAKSGQVDWGSPSVLHESSRARITLVPFFIPHTDRAELSVKILTHKKASPDWIISTDKSISLPPEATRRLFACLRTHLKIAETDGDGDFLLIQVSEGTAQLGNHDPGEIANALMKVLNQDEILAHLQNAELTAELTAALRGAIRLSEMRTAVLELRTALDGGNDAESTYQDWCEKHTWAFGNAYVVRDGVRDISTGDRLDLLLPTVIAGYRDVVELKRPNMEVLLYDRAHRNFYFASEVSQAIGQCHRYLDVLHEEAARGLRDHPEIVAYHPRATIVIGRSRGWHDNKLRALHGLNRRLSGINIMTYDHLLTQGERLIELFSAPPPSDAPDCDATDPDDDIPF